jgi:hypothetical protein
MALTGVQRSRAVYRNDVGRDVPARAVYLPPPPKHKVCSVVNLAPASVLSAEAAPAGQPFPFFGCDFRNATAVNVAPEPKKKDEGKVPSSQQPSVPLAATAASAPPPPPPRANKKPAFVPSPRAMQREYNRLFVPPVAAAAQSATAVLLADGDEELTRAQQQETMATQREDAFVERIQDASLSAVRELKRAAKQRERGEPVTSEYGGYMLNAVMSYVGDAEV